MGCFLKFLSIQSYQFNHLYYFLDLFLYLGTSILDSFIIQTKQDLKIRINICIKTNPMHAPPIKPPLFSKYLLNISPQL